MFGFNSKLLLSPYGCRRAHSTAVHGIGLSVNNIIHECLGLLRIIDTVRRDEFVTVFSHKHFKSKKSTEEYWSAFGNVVVQNVINQQTLETDTLYWDQANKEIYTDCYVRMFSNDGFLQGFGMRSDEMARNARIFKAFNSDLVVVQDSTKVIIDSVNFIGPLLKK